MMTNEQIAMCGVFGLTIFVALVDMQFRHMRRQMDAWRDAVLDALDEQFAAQIKDVKEVVGSRKLGAPIAAADCVSKGQMDNMMHSAGIYTSNSPATRPIPEPPKNNVDKLKTFLPDAQATVATKPTVEAVPKKKVVPKKKEGKKK